MGLDLLVLKADPDVASPQRLAAAREFAAEPSAPRRALVELGWERATSPTNYLGEFATAPPAELDRDAARSWLTARPDVLSTGFDGTAAIAAQLDISDPVSGLFELTEDERLAGYDALPDADQSRWVAAFQAIATEWLDVAAAMLAGATDLPQAGAWHEQVVQYHTTDGGLLLICAVDDRGDYAGAAAWFESVLFVLGEVADIAGVREPTSFDVR